MTRAAWHPDPTGRHETRYWDGSAWTVHVADAGVAGQDPPTWPPPPPATGLGLASGSLWFQRGDGRVPWAVVDAEGGVAGWVIPPAGLALGPPTVPLMDAERRPVLSVDQTMASGARVVVAGVEVARWRSVGVGGTHRVTVAMSVPSADTGRPRLALDTSLERLHAGPQPVRDPGGTPVATVAMRWNGQGDVDWHLARLVTLPPTRDAALLALPIAVSLDLDNRAAFAAGNRDPGERSDSRFWPGL